MKKMMRGFSLIELMIVIAIIGILMAIAIPSYNNYIFKSNVSELFAAATTAKAAVEENAATNALTGLSGVAAATLSPGFVGSSADHVTSITISTGGVINLQGDANTANTSVTFTPSFNSGGVISWVCHASPNTYAPSTCQ